MQKTLLNVTRSATKMIHSLHNKPVEERLSHLNLFSYEKRRLKWKLIECFKILDGFTNVDSTKLFVMDDPMRTRNNDSELKCRQFHSACTKFFFTNAVVRDWNRSPSLAVLCNSTASFKNDLDNYLHLNVQCVSLNIMVAAHQHTNCH